jgi:DNA modification methylase
MREFKQLDLGMYVTAKKQKHTWEEFHTFLSNFQFEHKKTQISEENVHNIAIKKYVNEFWTSRQRQATAIHEISYRACFKPQLPAFFIDRLTDEGEIIYDPFSGRGTTIIEAVLKGRIGIANDINPLSSILAKPRLFPPSAGDLEKRLNEIPFDNTKKADIDLSMFYHPDTEAEIVSLRGYLRQKKEHNSEDKIDEWIRMVATNRLTGHSKGFFSVYTLPPNQAVSQKSQKKINERRNQKPEYRNVKKIIIRKSQQLLKDLSPLERQNLGRNAGKSLFITEDARYTKQIPSDSIQLTVTSPPFLNIVQYSNDNWLRCWFNSLDDEEISNKITMSKTIEQWSSVMGDVFKELFRITKPGGWVAFEVGEVRKGQVKLDEYIVPLGVSAGYKCFGILINSQVFTKTSNIWGVNNNEGGTNTNRIAIFQKM